eukprot:m.176164 g.176164  ORF g.176164 m.176164 type:complete len:156 (-) comp31842_c4_seq12:512-979(-)
MGQPQGRSRHHKNKLGQKKSFRTKRRTRDVDQTRADMLNNVVVQKVAKETTVGDGDLPGMGKFYCLSCNRYMVDAHALQTHLRSKIHKRKIKKLQDEPYSHAEAEQAAGLGTYVPRTDVVSKEVLNEAVSSACDEVGVAMTNIAESIAAESEKKK